MSDEPVAGKHPRRADEPELDAELRAWLERDAAPSGEDRAVLEGLYGSLRARIDNRERTLSGRLSALPTARRVVLAASVPLLIAAVVVLLFRRPDFALVPPARMVFALASLFTAAVWLSAEALRPWQRPALSAAAAEVRFVLALGLSVLLSVLPVTHELLPFTEPPPGVPLWRHAAGCLGVGLAVGLPVFVVCRALSRATPYSSWMAAAASGLVGNLALQLHCPITDREHLLWGHASLGIAVVIFVFASTWLSRSRSAV